MGIHLKLIQYICQLSIYWYKTNLKKKQKKNNQWILHLRNHFLSLSWNYSTNTDEHYDVSTHEQLNCLWNSLFGKQQRNYQSPTLLVLCAGFASQRVSNIKIISMSWHHMTCSEQIGTNGHEISRVHCSQQVSKTEHPPPSTLLPVSWPW